MRQELIQQDTRTVGVAIRYKARRYYVGLAFLLPAIVFLLIFLIYPIVSGLSLSLRDAHSLSDTGRFIGLQNYAQALSDPTFRQVIGNTIFLTVALVTIETMLGVGLAVLLNRPLKGRAIFRTLLFLPVTFQYVVAGYQIKWLFNDQFGVINDILERLHIIHDPIAWTSTPGFAMIVVLVSDVWYSTPFLMLVALAALQSVPGHLHEAAMVDGASSWRRFWKITLPLIAPILLIGMTIRATDVFKIFDLVYITTYGGPAHSTEVLSLYTYRSAFSSLQIGYGAAISTIGLFVMLVMGIFLIVALRRFQLGRLA